MTFRLSSALGLLSALLATSAVSAQTTQSPTITQAITPSASALAARRALLDRAQAASQANRHAEALDLAEQAARIELTPSLRMFLAQERAATGAFSAAMEMAETCVREATHNATLERRDNILTECRRVARASQAHVALVTINAPGGLRSDAVLRLGTRPISASELGVPIPVDEGALELTVTAGTIEPMRQTLRLAGGSMQTLTVPERFAPEATTTQSASTSGTQTQNNATTTNANVTASNSVTTQSTNNNASTNTTPPNGTTIDPRSPPGFLSRVGAGPFVTLGIGATGVIVGAMAWIIRDGQFAAAMCHPDGAAIRCDTPSAAEAFANPGPGAPDPYTPHAISIGAFVVGGVALVAGTAWLVVANGRRVDERASWGSPRTQGPTVRQWAVLPTVTEPVQGIVLAGTF